MAEIRTFRIRAIVIDGMVRLLGRNGRQIVQVKESRVAKPCPMRRAETKAKKAEWVEWSTRMLFTSDARIKKRTRNADDPWMRKCDSWINCIKLRKRYAKPPKGIGRLHHEQYEESTWDDACKRMQIAGHNKYRRESRDEWQRWASTVSDNWKIKKERA